MLWSAHDFKRIRHSAMITIEMIYTPSSRIIVIRHAESAAQAGAASSDVAQIPLSKKGRAAAGELVTKLSRPDLVVVSPYIRTRQTAQPLIDLYPDVPVEEWAVQEFTYLDSARCMGMTAEQRAPLVREYWDCDDPDYIDGDGAESFGQFAERVVSFLLRCKVAEGRVYVFSHTMFMQAVRLHETDGLLDMATFRHACFASPIKNLEGLVVN